MKKLLVRGLLIVSLFSTFVALGPSASGHHGKQPNGDLHHCRWNPHVHPDKFYEGKSQSFIRRHKHHEHACNPDKYPPD